MIERLALGESGYHNSNEGRYQEDAYAMQSNLITPSPDGTCYALQELGYSELADPDEKSVVDSRRQDQFRAYLSEVYFVGGQVFGLNIVGSVHEDDVYQAHARKQGDQTQGHDPVFLEQSSSPDLPPSQAHEDDDDGKASTPPAEEKRRPVPTSSARLRRGSIP